MFKYVTPYTVLILLFVGILFANIRARRLKKLVCPKCVGRLTVSGGSLTGGVCYSCSDCDFYDWNEW